MKAFLSWASSIVFLIVLVAVLYAFAHKQFAGFPDEPEKNVSLVPSSSPPGDVALLLEPPMATRQMQGQSQTLALQFSNKTKQRIEVLPVRVEPQRCFALEPSGPGSMVLNGLDTVVKLDRLTFPESRDCLGESPLIFVYSWKALPDQPGKRVLRGHGRHRAARNSVKTQSPAVVQERSIATTPIKITNERLYSNERFVRIGQLVLVPVLLAIVTFIFQRLQAARDEAQSEETLKIEVWKIIHPTFLSMVKTYYAPMTRRMSAIIDLIEAKGPPEEELVLLLLLRRQMLVLLDKDAGYYFQSKPGEEICGILNDALVYLWRAHLGRTFDDAALLLTGSEGAQEAKRQLEASGVNLTKMAGALLAPSTRCPDPAAFSSQALRLFRTVLAFESDRPFDRVWYEAKFPPKISFAAFPEDLGWLREVDRSYMRDALNEYRTSIPWRCVSDESLGMRVGRVLRKLRPG